MKQCYIDALEDTFRNGTKILISQMNSIIAEYSKAGMRLTVRQLYYQLVSRDLVPNTERSYKRIIGTCNDGRYAGLIDWDAIEDRTRSFRGLERWESAKSMLEYRARSFHKDMWQSQDKRVFCIIEKDALVGVIRNACLEFDVPYMAARGHPSATVLREFVQRDLLPVEQDQSVIILHLGDHDPSGIDMTRDLRDRIAIFMESDNFELHRIALTMDQVRELKPPPNPAKVTDSRFAEYQRKFGNESWELDALPPTYIDALLRKEIAKYIDTRAWEDRQAEIEKVKKKIVKFAKTFKD